MHIELLTKADLKTLKEELLQEISELITPSQKSKTNWLKSKDVKRILKCSAGSLQNLRIRGYLNPKKIGGVYYYDRVEVEGLFE